MKYGLAKVCRHAVAVSMMLALASSSAWAARVMESERDTLQVRMVHGLKTDEMHHGAPFEATLTEDHEYNGKTLPAGTILKGQVNNSRHSMIMGMPGYVVLDVRELVLPSGETVSLEAEKTRRIVHNKAHTPKRLTKSAIPFTLISAADAVPLKYAAGFSSWHILPISLAARMALGVGFEMHEKKHNPDKYANKPHPEFSRVGYGMLRGTGLTGAYNLIHLSPEPNLTENAMVPLNFKKAELQSLFAAGQGKGTNTVTIPTDPEKPTAQKPVEPAPEVPAPASEKAPAHAALQDATPAIMENETQTFTQLYGKIPTATPEATAKPEVPAQPE